MASRRNRRRDINLDFTFTVRSEPIPAELRPEWRISLLLLLLLRAGRGGSMSLKKAHVLSSAIRTAEARERLLRMLDGNRYLDDVPVRVDPSLNRAIDYAIAEKVIVTEVRSNTCILKLLPSGEAIATQVYAASDCMQIEKEFANRLRGNLTNEKVDELLNWETTL